MSLSVAKDGAGGPFPRIATIDGLRAIAVGLILVEHDYLQVTIFSDWYGHRILKQLLGCTASGVELFFVISGFLIGSILLRNRGAENLASVFYVRRLCRTIPLYFVLLLSFVVARNSSVFSTNAFKYYIDDSIPLLAYAGFAQGFWMVARDTIGPFWLVVTWSLTVEEHFYLLMPLLLRFMRSSFLPLLIGAAAVACPLLRWGLYANNRDLAALYLLPSRMDNLLLGVLLAVLWQTPAWMSRLASYRGTLRLLLVGATLIFVPTPMVLPWWLSISVQGGSFFLLLLYVLLFPDSRLCQLLSWRPLVFIGGISYFLYLFHLPLLYTFHALLHGSPPLHIGLIGRFATLASIAAGVFLGALSERYFERPFIRLGHRLRYRPTPAHA